MNTFEARPRRSAFGGLFTRGDSERRKPGCETAGLLRIRPARILRQAAKWPQGNGQGPVSPGGSSFGRTRAGYTAPSECEVQAGLRGVSRVLLRKTLQSWVLDTQRQEWQNEQAGFRQYVKKINTRAAWFIFSGLGAGRTTLPTSGFQGRLACWFGIRWLASRPLLRVLLCKTRIVNRAQRVLTFYSPPWQKCVSQVLRSRS